MNLRQQLVDRIYTYKSTYKLIYVIIHPDRSCYIEVVVGFFAYRDDPTELFWLGHTFLYVLSCQAGRLENVKTKSAATQGLRAKS